MHSFAEAVFLANISMVYEPSFCKKVKKTFFHSYGAAILFYTNLPGFRFLPEDARSRTDNRCFLFSAFSSLEKTEILVKKIYKLVNKGRFAF
jgi:hypothetical protein